MYEWLDIIVRSPNNFNYSVVVDLSLIVLGNARVECASELLSSVVVDTTPGSDFGEVATYRSSKLNNDAVSPP